MAVVPPQGGVGGVRRKVQSVEAATEALPLLPTTTKTPLQVSPAHDTPHHPSNGGGKGGAITIVNAHVQGWTSFWEVCSSDTMKNAFEIYDNIMRHAYTESGGYEIKAEGGVFHIAFMQPVDAMTFALQAQIKLHAATWPEGILLHTDGKVEPALKLNGFRVKIAIHHGLAVRRVHESTGRTIYSGEAVEIAKAVADMCHGGQILTTIETWNAVCDHVVFTTADGKCLGRPQVVDCGDHLLFTTKVGMTNGHHHHHHGGGSSSSSSSKKCTRRIMQLVPNELAFDFFEARGRREKPIPYGQMMEYEIKNSLLVHGRLFPPLNSKRQLTTCFLNAPYANGRVTICFLHTVGLDYETDNDNPTTHQTTINHAILAKQIRKHLLMIDPPGYECREDDGSWMIAFDTMAHAVTFGLSLNSSILRDDDVVSNSLVGKNNVNRSAMFKIGIVSGPFTSMGPHKTTGKAEYFGPIVNRAMQVASNCIPGEVSVGIPLSDGATVNDSPDFGPTVHVKLQGITKLVGIALNVAIFVCSRSSSRIENLL